MAYQHAAQLMDATRVLPLSVGLALNLTARASAVVEVRGSVRADPGRLLTERRGQIDWNLHPSAVVTFDGAMIVDAHVAKGLRRRILPSSEDSALDGLDSWMTHFEWLLKNMAFVTFF